MFVRALKAVSAYTEPVIVFKRLESGKVESTCATFIRLNSEGWILTAAHVLHDLKLFEQQKAERRGSQIRKAAIQGDKTLTDRQKKLQISQIPKTPNHIINIAYWWACDDVQMGETITDLLIDLAAIKLNGLPPLPEDCYPVFKNLPAYIDSFPAGRSLCRLGLPSQDISATYSETRQRFDLASGTLPLPRFPHDGILARDVLALDEKTGRMARFIETSIPGLQGESGGPIFDVEGSIWGIESQISYSSYGFSPRLQPGSKQSMDHPFRNGGIAVHAMEVIAFLRSNDINVNVSID